jgi:hypothetical protein
LIRRQAEEKALEAKKEVESHPEKTDEEDEEDNDGDFLDQVELIVEEFMDILVGDIEADPELVIGRVLNEDDFADKFPFLEEIRRQQEEEARRLKEEEEKKAAEAARREEAKAAKRPDEAARERYEQEVKKLNGRLD